MKQFLIPPLIVMLLSSILLGYFLWRVPPFAGQPPEIQIFHNRLVVFLLSLFFFLISLVSLILYLIYRLFKDYRRPRYTYRRALRQGFLAGLGTVVVAILLLTQTANILTLGLTLAAVISLEFTLRGE